MQEKYLILCEGANEKKIIDLLLDNGKLKIKRENLIGSIPYNTRQLKHSVVITELMHYGKPVIVYRIGDKQTDELKIPKELKNIILKKDIHKYCTKPELEMLLIINEGLVSEFNKSKYMPKQFAKSKIKLNNKKYDQSCEFLENYYGGKNIELLVKNIIDYKNIKKHNKDELYLADLLK